MEKFWSKWDKKAKNILLSCCLLLILGIACFSLLLGIVLSGSKDSIQGTPEIMIILGCQVMNWGPSQSLADRLDKSLEYLEKNPNLEIIVSGGQGSNEPTTEAFAMAQYLIEHGIEENQIHLEANSRNTHQNLSFSTDLIQEKGLEGDVIIVSSGFHLSRAKFLWGRVGNNPDTLSLLAADVTDFPSAIKSHIREPLALVKSFLFDQGKAVLSE